MTKKQTNLADIDLGNQKTIHISNRYLPVKKVNEASVKNAIEELKGEGAGVIVASMAFGVDDGGPEQMIYELSEAEGMPATMASDITKLYGLTRRTRTAAINASILPKMLDTANSTEASVREAGVKVPLMIMRGDGGVMEINEMKKRPVLTMLSGPAASVMGSLMYLRASNGVYFEVGGTTTNIGVIKNGRPAIDYSVVGGHPTYISSLDVRVLGVAGGSMVRADQNGVIDVGPRSAHIAGLEYAVYSQPEKLDGGRVELFSPKPGDPADYVKIVLPDGQAVTITNSCAANVLGLVKPEHFSYGNQEAARKAMQILADYCGTTAEDIATQIMERAYAKIEPVILELAEKYQLEKDQISLVGVGGGAASLIVYFSEKMGVKYSIPENAEVISSIGVALSMVRDVVERILPHPTEDDIRDLKNEALNKAVESGATPESVEIHVAIDSQTNKVTAIATGSTEVKTSDTGAVITEAEALELAAEDMRLDSAAVTCAAKTEAFYVVSDTSDTTAAGALRILDRRGFIKVQRGFAKCVETTARDYLTPLKTFWNDMGVFKGEVAVRPDYYLCIGARIVDFSLTEFEQLKILTGLEVASLNPEDKLLIVAANMK